jgi:hypothetical protein
LLFSRAPYMRRYLLSLVVFLVVASAATGVHASTDCQRWFAEYKNSLAQSNAAKHLIAAKHRAHRYVHRKLAALHKPKQANKPRMLPSRFQRPKMTREEALRRFNLACGDMPEDMPTTQMVHEEDPKPDFLASSQHDMPLEKPDGGIVAKNVIPPFSEGGGWQYPSGFFGGGTPTGGPGAPTGGTAPPDAPPGSPAPPVTPPVSPVPEPGSIVLMLTGVAGAAGMARRKFVR